MPELFLRLPAQYNLSVICPVTSVKMMGLAKWCGVNGNAGRSNHTAPPTVERRVLPLPEFHERGFSVESVERLTIPKTLVNFQVVPGLRIADLHAKDYGSAQARKLNAFVWLA